MTTASARWEVPLPPSNDVKALMAVLVHDFTGDAMDVEEGAREVACGGGGMMHVGMSLLLLLLLVVMR